MNQIFAALLLALMTTMSGCSASPEVDKGGGELAVVVLDNLRQPTGRIDVTGHVVNSGEVKAREVVLHFTFFEDGALFLEGELLVGDLPRGASADFTGSFYGPPVKGVFTWDYRIDWD
jgi:hypothetical protein